MKIHYRNRHTLHSGDILDMGKKTNDQNKHGSKQGMGVGVAEEGEFG